MIKKFYTTKSQLRHFLYMFHIYKKDTNPSLAMQKSRIKVFS